MKSNKLDKYILNKCGPKIDLCGTPKSIFFQDLIQVPVLVLCFLFFR